MSENTITPAAAARAWAREHPEYSGYLAVSSWTRKGKGGRLGLTRRTNFFMVRDGQAGASRRQPGTDRHTGYCEVCGLLYLEPVVTWCHAPDPQAGEPVPSDEIWSLWRDAGGRFVYADQATLQACQCCIAEHEELEAEYLSDGPQWGSGETTPWVRHHPDYPDIAGPGLHNCAELDIRTRKEPNP